MFAGEPNVYASWSEMSEYQRWVAKGLLEAQVRAALGAGIHEFDSLSELFSAIGVRHITTGEIKTPNPSGKNFPIGTIPSQFAMSKRRLFSMLRGSKVVRIQQFSHRAILRDEKLRFLVAVAK